MYKNTCWWICMQNFKSLFEKRLSLEKNGRFWVPKKSLFTLFARISKFFLFLIFVRFGPFKKCPKVIFAFLTKIWPKKGATPPFHTPKLKSLNLTFSEFMTWMTYKRLSGVLKTRSMSFLGFISVWYGCFARRSQQGQKTQKKTFDPTCDVIKTSQIKFATYSEISHPELSNAVFGSRIGSVKSRIWQIAKGAETPPPPIGGYGPGITCIYLP